MTNPALARLSSLAIFLGALPFAACECDSGLYRREAQAELAFGDDVTPPLPHLEVGLPSTLIGQSSERSLQLRNTGDAVLIVSRLSLAADAELCPNASSAFSVLSPSVPSGGDVRVEPEEEIEVKLGFAPGDGAAGCAVLFVESNDFQEPTLKALLTGQGDAPQLCAERAHVDFGELLVGEEAEDVLELTSCGTRPVVLTSLDDNGRFPPFGHEELGLPLTLDPGETLALGVRFAPTQVGTWTLASGGAGLLTLEDEDGQAYQLTLEGRSRPVPRCDLRALPSQVSFGTVQQGASGEQDVVLRNGGEAPCTVESVVVREPAGPFTIDLQGLAEGDEIAPAELVTLKAHFTPPADSGIFTGFLDVESSDPVQPALEIPLQANVPGEDGCQIEVLPPTVSFGVVPLNELRSQAIVVRNISSDPCFLTGTSLEPGTDPGFIDTAPNFGLLLPGASKDLSVSFRSPQPGTFNGTLLIETNDDDTPDFLVPLSAATAAPGICVQPQHLAFGATNATATLDFVVTACGSHLVTVTGLPWSTPDPEVTLSPSPSLPFTLAAGEQRSVSVRYTPTDDVGDYAVVTVQSDDLARPEVPVEVTGGPEIVPVQAGRYLYYWQIPNTLSPVGGDVVQVPLQGNVQVEPFWGPRTGKGCTGCHSVSPDGAFVAVVETSQMRFIDRQSGSELFLVNPFLDSTYFSWNPDVNTDPPYQFAYSDGRDVHIAALFDGPLGALAGADDPDLIETMPSWGADGVIAFVRGEQAAQTETGDEWGLQGPTDILVVDEGGGTPQYLEGASQNGQANYYPAHSPDGRWIAFTQSLLAESTIAATDARVRLVRADNSGDLRTLDATNGNDGASSYPTWSVDGSFLSFSSSRAGGAGDWDIYLAEADSLAGTAGAAMNLNDFGFGALNTSGFEHAAEWSP